MDGPRACELSDVESSIELINKTFREETGQDIRTDYPLVYDSSMLEFRRIIKIDNKVGISESLEGLVESYLSIKNFDKAKHYIGLSIDNYKKKNEYKYNFSFSFGNSCLPKFIFNL